ncbi:glutamyl-Q tRNA(Asp) ligase [Salinisphaera sp. T31B1]
MAAVASFVHARAQGGQWLVRIDDLDTPRVVPNADRHILNTLSAFGLRWDGQVMHQADRREAYRAAIERLRSQGDAFECGCTRREARAGRVGIEGPVYPGTCRRGLPAGRRARSVRLKVSNRPTVLHDAVQGHYEQILADDIGDFVIRRADGITAYQLATVVDDAFQQITEVVRGADLLSSTPRQIWLQERLGYPRPNYAHVPVLVDTAGQKLGKSQGALALRSERRSAQLWVCLSMLGQEPPDRLCDASQESVLGWAVDAWSVGDVPSRVELAAHAYQRSWSHRSGLAQ